MSSSVKIKFLSVRHKLSGFTSSESGSIGILFGMAFLPLVFSVGAAIDYGNATSSRIVLQSALDSAVLAGAQGTHLSTEERISVATKLFEKNFPVNNMMIRPTPAINVAANGRVSGKVRTSVKTMFMKLAGSHGVEINAVSSAQAINPQPICLLALNKTMDKAIEISGTGTLEAINCAVQANSDSSIAIYANGSGTVKAEAFCSPGGFYGLGFSPTPKRCYTVEDPYKSMVLPAGDTCAHTDKKVEEKDGGVTLYPGTYCGGIDVRDRAEIEMKPGVYILRGGPFHAHSRSKIKGEGVTIFLTGNNTEVSVNGSAEVTLKAPTSGTYEGFLFIQDPDSNPGEVNRINGGGSIKLVGTLYFPTQGVNVGGSGTLGINSPMMPIIADHFIVNGRGVFNVDLDEANMKVRLPMTNDGSVVMN